MGLSKKLGSRVGSSSLNEIEYQWSTQCYTLKEVIDKFNFPRVVQCAADSCTVLWAQFRFQMKQPLVLYSSRVVRKVFARSLKLNRDTKMYEEFGPPLIIPEDHKGWFSIVTAHSNTLPRHTRIESIAKNEVKTFLVTTQLPVLVLAPGPRGEAQYVTSDVMPGEILRAIGVCQSNAEMMTQLTTLSKGKKCLRCIDEKKDEVVVPFSHRAILYEISNEISANTRGLFRMENVVQAGETLFPTVIRHVFGDPPAVAYSFTGILKLEKMFSEETVMASTLDSQIALPLEIKLESRVKFYIALNEGDIKRTAEYSNAYSTCEDSSEKYVTQMKVAFTLRPGMSPLEALDLSLYETGSAASASANDAEDVDANSEFVIDWDPDRKNSVLSSENSHGLSNGEVTTPENNHAEFDDPDFCGKEQMV